MFDFDFGDIVDSTGEIVESAADLCSDFGGFGDEIVESAADLCSDFGGFGDEIVESAADSIADLSSDLTVVVGDVAIRDVFTLIGSLIGGEAGKRVGEVLDEHTKDDEIKI